MNILEARGITVNKVKSVSGRRSTYTFEQKRNYRRTKRSGTLKTFLFS